MAFVQLLLQVARAPAEDLALLLARHGAGLAVVAAVLALLSERQLVPNAVQLGGAVPALLALSV